MPDIRVAERRSDNNLLRLLSFNPSSILASFSIPRLRYVSLKRNKERKKVVKRIHFPFTSFENQNFFYKSPKVPRESLSSEIQRKSTRVNRDKEIFTARLNYSNYPRMERPRRRYTGRWKACTRKGWLGGVEIGRWSRRRPTGCTRPDNKLSLPRRYHVFSFRPGACLPPRAISICPPESETVSQLPTARVQRRRRTRLGHHRGE